MTKLAPPLRGFPATIDSGSLKRSLLSFLGDGKSRSAETLARMCEAPLILTQQNLIKLAKAKKIVSPGVTTEDGEVRVLLAIAKK